MIRHLPTVFILLCFPLVLQAQDPSWFSDITAGMPFAGQQLQKSYVADLNNDNYPDLVTISSVDYFNNRKPVKLYINVKDPSSSNPQDRTFVDRTAASNINGNVMEGDTGRQTTCLAMADVDNDGDMDIVTAHYYHRIETYTDVGDRCQVLLNDGFAHFTIRKNNGLEALGLTNTQGLTFLDYDKDGNVDLFMGNWFSDYTQNVFTQSFLMRGNGDGTFTNKTIGSGINQPILEALYGSTAGDWNNDGWMDIFSAPYCRTKGSLYKNNGDGTFDTAATDANYSIFLMKGDNGQAMCLWAAMPCDYDNDGDLDFYYALVHGGLDFNEGRSTIVKNLGPAQNYRLRWELNKLRRVAPRASHIATYEAAWLDYDNDGWMDLSHADGTYAGGGNGRLFMFRQILPDSFKDVTSALGLISPQYTTMSMVRAFDMDLDGDDDILTNGGQATVKPTLLRNNIGNQSNWVAVKVLPTGKYKINRSAVGAKVRVYAGDLTMTREIYAGEGNAAGQRPLILNFGLGTRTTIDSIVVDFPDKRNTRVVKTNLSPGQMYIIKDFDVQTPGDHFVLYPNPTAGRTSIALPESYSGKIHVTVVDDIGRTVAEHWYTAGDADFELVMEGMSAGTYAITVMSENGWTDTEKLIVE